MISRLIELGNPRYVWRDAGTGKYVSRLYALLHPSTTVKERTK